MITITRLFGSELFCFDAVPSVGEPGKAAHSLRNIGPVNDGGDSVSDATPGSQRPLLFCGCLDFLHSVPQDCYLKVWLGPRASILIQHNLSTQKKWRDAK